MSHLPLHQTNLPLWASSDPFTGFSSHDLFIRSTWTYFAFIVTCSWNGLEHYWIGIGVSHSWDLGNWGSMPATVFHFDSTNGLLFSMMFLKKSHNNFSFRSQVSIHEIPKTVPINSCFWWNKISKRFFINVSKVSIMFKLYFEVILWIHISPKHNFKLFAPHTY